MANDKYWGLSSEELEVLEPKEELRLIKNAQAGDKDAYDEIVQHNLKLVWSVAKGMGSSGVGVDFDDRIQNGSLGLMTAVDKFDPEKINPETGKPYKFSTYATWWIRQAISRGTAEMDRLIRLPVHCIEKLIDIDKFVKNYQNENGEEPDKETVREAFPEITRETFDAIYNVQCPVSFDNIVHRVAEDDGENSVGDLIAYINPSVLDADTVSDVERESERRFLGEKVREAWKKFLDEREILVIGYRFGLIDGKEYTLEQVADLLPVTQDKCANVERKLFKTIIDKHLLTDMELQVYAMRFGLLKEADGDVMNADIADTLGVSETRVQELLNSAINKVSKLEMKPQTKLIFELRTGLNEDGIMYSLAETTEKAKVTRERVRQIEAKAIRKLRVKGHDTLNGLDGVVRKKLKCRVDQADVGSGSGYRSYRRQSSIA